MKGERPDIVYHYCTLQGFLSIIQNASLWMSDISKSNDYLECIYIRDQIKKSIEKEIEFDKEALDAWNKQKEYVEKIVKENIKRTREKGVFHAGVELNSNYKMGFSLYKHTSFTEEEEWRLVLNSYPYGHEMKIGNIIFSEPQYRVAREKLISYRELLFSDVKREFIREIWIGPKADVEPQDIGNVLRRYNYYDIEREYSLKEPILITRSLSSYR